jgi:hypothetical protein
MAMFFTNGAIVGYYSAFALGFPAHARATGARGFVSWVSDGWARQGRRSSPAICSRRLATSSLLLVSFLMSLGSVAALVLFLLLPMRDADAEMAEGIAGRAGRLTGPSRILNMMILS